MEEPIPKSGPVVAIDGPAGVGKSTLARRLAEVLGLAYVNTGTMYRAVAGEALARGVSAADGPSLGRLARSLRFRLDRTMEPPSLVVDGIGEDALIDAEVEASVSAVAAHPEVRSVLRAEQRRLGAEGAVVEGRDIGSVVFPDADVKVFLEASAEERASRRRAERTDDRVAEAMARRDALDSKVNPFVPAGDAIFLDTTGRSADEVFREALALCAEVLGLPGIPP